MARPRGRRSPDKDEVGTSEDTEATESTESVTETAPESEEPAGSEAPTPIQSLPDRTPRVTIHAFVRGTKDPILRAFASQEKLTQPVRKLTRAEWKTAFEAFKAQPR